jgi:hypothetical protein
MMAPARGPRERNTGRGRVPSSPTPGLYDVERTAARPYAIATEGARLDQLEVVPYAHERPTVPRQLNDRTGAEDSVDGTTFKAERAQIAARQECVRPF